MLPEVLQEGPPDWVIGAAGTTMTVNLLTLPLPAHPQDRYEMERALEAQMDSLFGAHLAVHIWALEPTLDVVFGANVSGDAWWKGRHGA